MRDIKRVHVLHGAHQLEEHLCAFSLSGVSAVGTELHQLLKALAFYVLHDQI